MKLLKLVITSLAIIPLTFGCGTTNNEANKEGFTEIQNQIQAEFGNSAYYTDFTITCNESIGNIINLTVTKDPKSLTMEEWNQTQDVWEQTADVTIEIPVETEATDFMFQFGDEISLSKLGELIEKSKKQLISEKELKNPRLSSASILFPDNGDVSAAEYYISLEPEDGGTAFNFYYNLKGELREMDY